MPEDDIDKILNDVIGNISENRRKKVIEAWIHDRASFGAGSFYNLMKHTQGVRDPQVEAEIAAWSQTRASEMSLIIEEVIAKLLRCELLHES